jgi:diguanylate cyclase (GGDEF)-like protein
VGHALERQVRDPSGVAVLLLDLDGFKTVNDGLGHSVGDELLVAVADRLRAVLRASDTAARLGGDEFAVLLEQVESRDEALDIAGRMLDVFTAPFCVSHTEVFVRASIGIALGDSDPDALLADADAASYRAKAAGRGRIELFG